MEENQYSIKATTLIMGSSFGIKNNIEMFITFHVNIEKY